MGLYPKIPYEAGRDTSVLQCNRLSDKTIAVRPDLAGNIIIIHGVNDVGVGYDQVEQGLCAGLNQRLSAHMQPAGYRMPNKDDKNKLEDDPDAVFFKRRFDENTHSPVIPFYWGYAEAFKQSKTRNGQKTDRYGNRLDKDLSKGGGPFSNATSTLPDMWNRGTGAPVDPVGDPIRPILNAPGRMYMILAAKRLAALITMIRDYDPNETVSLVAHSQGTMLSLLAQAFLMDQGERPADTLVLMNSPYSLHERTTLKMDGVDVGGSFTGGTDPAMDDYGPISARQCFDARLDTLINIVQGVAERKSIVPAFATLDDHATHCGMVGGQWVADKDRDNRGKVYLYFSPEDMTVALDNIRGIGWQGVPDCLDDGAMVSAKRYPMAELSKKVGTPSASGFYQRVFTNKLRLDQATKKLGPVKVGQGPHDFALRIKGEDEHAHVTAPNRGNRGNSPAVEWPIPDAGAHWYESTARHANSQREGIRTINGEALPRPAIAELCGNQIAPKDLPKGSAEAKLPAKDQGPYEDVDPIDAATALASDKGLKPVRQYMIDDPRPSHGRIPGHSPDQLGSAEIAQLQAALNQGKDTDDQCEVVRAAHCDGGKILLNRLETPNEARLRWQHEVSAKSFHSAIFGNKANHANVTAYDVAIGGGTASSDPAFYAYLCAVADWRLKKPQPNTKARPSIRKWIDFTQKFSLYWTKEPKWRADLIEGNCIYYSTGELPTCIPGLRQGLPTKVVCQKAGGEPMKHAAPNLSTSLPHTAASQER